MIKYGIVTLIEEKISVRRLKEPKIKCFRAVEAASAVIMA